MLTIVNEDLMSFEPTFVNDKIAHRVFFKLRLLTTNRLLQKQSELDKKDPRGIKNPTKTGDYCLVDMSDRIVPVNREIMRVAIPYREITSLMEAKEKIKSIPLEWNKYPMSVYVSNVGRYSRQVDVRCHTGGDDRTNIFVVAFPFNGMIRPIREDPRYRVYKGFISSSIKPFFFNGHKYRKVLYLVIEINKYLFNEDHHFHTDNIDIPIESFALFTDRTTGERRTNHEKMVINITSSSGDYNLDWTYDVIDHEVLMNMPNVDLWPTYNFNKEQSSNDSRRKNGYRKKGQRPMVIEGNTMVTTNKHGIRMEIPLNKNRNGGKSYYTDQYRYDKDNPRNKDNDSKPQNNRHQNGQNRKTKKGRRK